ncbi:MAG: nitrous oxide reductase accessory protein NosL [Sulfuricella sp.]|nr:nitrous oxide reductase accessory protein NosL [Sulfuricella sp.]
MAVRRMFHKSALALFGALFLTGTAGAAAPAPGQPQELHCPVCRMNPANYPKWRCRIVFRDSAAADFDSPADLFRFLGNMAKYDRQHAAADIAQIDVTDYARRVRIDARRAFFVAGSSIRGPMGPDLPAFENRADAEFLARSAGGKVIGFDQAIREINGAPAR